MGLRCFTAPLVLMAAASLSIFAAETIQPANPNDGWKLIKEGGGISLYSRSRAGTALKEFKALGEIEASTRAVHNVLDDLENYSSFMPYTVECRLIKREGDSIYSYQRLSPRIVCDRDYTLRRSRDIMACSGRDGLSERMATGERVWSRRKAGRVASKTGRRLVAFGTGRSGQNSRHLFNLYR